MRQDQPTAASGPSGPAHRRAAEGCWLSGLQLVAVQPACLKARPVFPVHHQPQQAAQGDLQEIAGAAAAGGLQLEQHEMNLLLQLEARLTDEPCHQRRVLAHSPGTAVPGSPVLPLPLTQAELELLILSQQMQLLHQTHFNVLQLVSQQQEQQLEQQFPSFPAPESPPPGRVADTAVQEAPGSLSRANSSQSSSSLGQSDSSATVATHRHAGAETADTLSPQGSNEQPAHDGGTSSDWTVPLYLHVTFPAPAAAQLVDYLHLILTVRNVGQQQVDQQAGTSADAGTQAAADEPHTAVVAEVPLLVLPAVAQQEVQQLLLPAMRQEVQAEQQQQQQQQGQQPSSTPDDFARQCLLVEHAVWSHWCNLANDICFAVQLCQAVQVGAAAAPQQAAIAQAAAAVAAAQGLDQLPWPVAVVNGLSAESAGDAAAAAVTVAVVPAPATALEQVAAGLLFPLLLPFLAAHGLHNLLQLLLSCLPVQLQQQWQEQQTARLQELTETAPVATRWPELPEEAPEAVAVAAAVAALPAAGQMSVGTTGSSVEPGAVGTVAVQPGAPAVAASSSGLRHREIQQQFKQGAGNIPSTAAPAAVDKEIVEAVKPLGGASSHAAESEAASAASAAAAVSWHSPITKFEPDLEQRYINWKHQSLSYLDYFAAVFGVVYLAVLLKRSYSEPTTLFYALVIMIKTLPHVPLICRCNRFFFRHRECLLFMVAPVSILTFIWFTVIQQIGDPEALLPNKTMTAYWAGHGEIATSAMRPFTQHMRLRKYMLYCLLDASIMVWVFGKVYGVWAAAGRWGFACGLSVALAWGLDLHMRRSFIGRRRVE